MASPYANPGSGSSGGSVYANPGAGGGTTASAEPKKKKGGGGFLGTLAHVVNQTPTDLINTAYNAPGGIYKLTKDAVAPGNSGADSFSKQWGDLLHGHLGRVFSEKNFKADPLGQDLLAAGKSTVETAKHPLRNPGNTLLLGAPLLGRAGLAGRAAAGAERGGRVGAAARATVARPADTLGERAIRVNGGATPSPTGFSRSATGALFQHGSDKLLEKAAGSNVKGVGAFGRRVTEGRAGKWADRAQRVEDAKAAAPGIRLAKAAEKLSPVELRALRMVAEETPAELRISSRHMRMSQAKGKEVGRHQERLDLERRASAILHVGENDRPVFRSVDKKLTRVYRLLEDASTGREDMLKQLDLMDESAARASKIKQARLAGGASYRERTDGPRTRRQAESRFATLERDQDADVEKLGKAWFGGTEALGGKAETARRNRDNYKTSLQEQGVTRTGRQAGAKGTRKAQRRDTLTTELGRMVHAQIEKLAKTHPDEPVVKNFLDRNAEIERLREALAPAQEWLGDLASTHSFLKHLPEDFRVGQSVRKAGQKTIGKVADIQGDHALVFYPRYSRSVKIPLDDLETNVGKVLQGAEDVMPSEDAVFIGNPVERTKFTGRPKVSTRSTFGHTRKPASLKESTGAAVEHALERNDTGNIVAERHGEAVRLMSIARRVEKAQPHKTMVPHSDNDVWVWDDKTVSQERIPAEVTKYIDNPEGLRDMPASEVKNLRERLRSAFVETEWKTNEDAFLHLAKQGKGGFVPRRVLGDAAKPYYGFSDVKGVAGLDAINNAQKLALIYAKPAYPVVQGLGNVAFNFIQQGFAAPKNLTIAARLSHHLGADYAGLIDHIMGQGAIPQTELAGQGRLAGLSHKVAGVATKYVDTPSRRAAFLDEAHKAGYKTPEQIKALLDDDKNIGDLINVSQRAKEAIVDYEDLSPFEKEFVRRLTFIYPWTKGSVKYAGYFLRDHPVQAAALTLLAKQQEAQNEEQVGALPSYMRGSFVADGGLVNPASANPFQTPASIGDAMLGLLGKSHDHPTGQDYLAPGPALAVALMTGKNDIGQPLQGNIGSKLRQTLVEPAPISGVVRALATHSQGTPGDLTRDVFGSRTATKSFPVGSDAYWRYIFGSLKPRRFDRAQINSNAALEKTGR